MSTNCATTTGSAVDVLSSSLGQFGYQTSQLEWKSDASQGCFELDFEFP